MEPKFLSKKVINHFTEASENYALRKGIVHPEHDPIIVDFIHSTCSVGSKILEVGGGSGYFLDLVAQNTPVRALYNCELVPEIYSKQVNGDICLIGGTVLKLPFKDSSFDYVVIKNLLHHLVGRTRRESKENCRKAIDELCRVVKNAGYVIVLEQYNRYDIFASIIFYITLFLSIIGAGFKPLGLRKNVIVSFFTPDGIITLLQDEKRVRVEVILSRINRLSVPASSKLTLLMSDIGRMLLIGKVHKN